MKKSLVTALALSGLLLATPNGIAFGDNLVTNGGFETKASDSRPENWQITISRGTKAETGFSENEKHSGDYSFKVDIDPPGGRVVFYPEKGSIKGIEPGKTYEVSFWINARGLDYNQFFLAPAARFNFRPSRVSPVPTIDLMAEMNNVSGWKRLSVKSIAPADADEITLDFILTKGTVFIDDVVVQAVE